MSAQRSPLLPADWSTPPVYARFSVQLGKMLDEKQIAGTHLAPYLRNVDVQWGNVNTTDLPEMDFSAEDRKRFALRKGDLLVCEGGEVGRTAIWKGNLAECYYQKAIHRLRPITGRDDPRFFRYFMWMAVHEGMFAQATASTIQHLTAEKLRIVRYPAPPPAMQRAIADYLDRETVRLDGLVAAKERLLGLLAEKRRALITRAVTRGLDLRAPLRESGIPWLGDIPAHWENSKFTWSVFIIEGQVDPEVEPYVNMTLIAPNHVESGTGRLLSQETAADQGAISGKYLCQRGDVIYSKIRPALRKATIAVEECLCSADMYPLRARDGIQPEFLLLFLLSEPFSTWAVLESNRVAMPKINREALSEIRIPVPPPEEQRQIVAHIKDATARLDDVRSATERTTTLIKERRAALIAAAVTGQIDVGAKSA